MWTKKILIFIFFWSIIIFCINLSIEPFLLQLLQTVSAPPFFPFLPPKNALEQYSLSSFLAEVVVLSIFGVFFVLIRTEIEINSNKNYFKALLLLCFYH